MGFGKVATFCCILKNTCDVQHYVTVKVLVNKTLNGWLHQFKVVGCCEERYFIDFANVLLTLHSAVSYHVAYVGRFTDKVCTTGFSFVHTNEAMKTKINFLSFFFFK